MAILKLDYNALWDSICKWSRKAGRAATRPVLLMWYVMRSKETPRKDKWAIFGSLLAVMVQKMSKYITPEMQGKADAQLDKWFPECVEYELIEG